MIKCEHDKWTEVKKEVPVFPIRCENIGITDNICFKYPDGYKASMSVVLFNLGLDREAIYKEYNMEYTGFDYFRMKEEDIKRFVKYINSLALLKKI